MDSVEDYLVPILGAHLSLLIGLLSYACRFCNRNSLFGVRTPYTLKSDENWREVNDRVSRRVPPASVMAGLIAIAGFAFAPLRQPWALFLVLAVQLGAGAFAVLLGRPQRN